MFSVIICSIDPVKFAQIRKHYQQLFRGEPYELIGIHDAKSLSEGYNRGLAQAKGEFIIFCHDDIEFVSPGDWLARLKNHLAKFDIVGLVGTTKLVHGMWIYAGPPYIFGQVVHSGGTPDWPEQYRLEIFSTPAAVVRDIQAMDGMFIAVHREVLEKVKFDEKTFDGFHCYDIDFTFSAYLAGFKLAVACDLPVIHRSKGSMNETWLNAMKKFFVKYNTRLARAKKRRFAVTLMAVETKEELLELMLPQHVAKGP
ncbi:MAG TPA: glycosyltransferase [Phycisphaerae bacterium]|nr:glycosyltransferase [Phycisphaerae bacterium]